MSCWGAKTKNLCFIGKWLTVAEWVSLFEDRPWWFLSSGGSSKPTAVTLRLLTVVSSLITLPFLLLIVKQVTENRINRKVQKKQNSNVSNHIHFQNHPTVQNPILETGNSEYLDLMVYQTSCRLIFCRSTNPFSSIRQTFFKSWQAMYQSKSIRHEFFNFGTSFWITPNLVLTAFIHVHCSVLYKFLPFWVRLL